MPISISSTNPVTGEYPADVAPFTGSSAELRASRLVADTPAAVASGWVSTSPTVGQVIAEVEAALPTAIDPDIIPAAKRIAVASAIIASVAVGGPPWLIEPDAQWYRFAFVDNRSTFQRWDYTCRKQANYITGATEFCWYRTLFS